MARLGANDHVANKPSARAPAAAPGTAADDDDDNDDADGTKSLPPPPTAGCGRSLKGFTSAEKMLGLPGAWSRHET